MKVTLLGSTNGLDNFQNLSRFGQSCARICNSEKDFEELQEEPRKDELIRGVMESGHHSVFEHTFHNFFMDGLPKALVMVLNNERVYTTSEKSARYTQMSEVVSEQKELYEKWMEKIEPRISAVYPQMDNLEQRDKNVKKLCQENARYMTSVFTPTKMAHTLSLRQLNFLIHEFERFAAANASGKDEFKRRLADSMNEFLAQEDVSKLKVETLDNQTDRHLSFFREKAVEKHFGDTYSRSYLMSFAGLAQAHRHRTLSYGVSDGYQLGAPIGFFVPEIIRDNGELVWEWEKDLRKVSSNDFPQAQLLVVNERGNLEDFRSKCILRLCGHAQHEIMRNTLETAEQYAEQRPETASWKKPKCMQGMKCSSPCVWTGKRALERIV